MSEVATQRAVIVGETGERTTEMAVLLHQTLRRNGGAVSHDEAPTDLTPRGARSLMRDIHADMVVMFTDDAVLTRTKDGTERLPLGELPVMCADSPAPHFVQALLRGEIRPEHHDFWATVQRNDAVKGAAERLIRTTAPANERETLLHRLGRNRFDAGSLGRLLIGALADPTPVYESKRAFCRSLLRATA